MVTFSPSRERVKEFFKQCMVPINVDGLNPVRINEILYAKLTFEEKLNDQKLHGINSFLYEDWDRSFPFGINYLNLSQLC